MNRDKQQDSKQENQDNNREGQKRQQTSQAVDGRERSSVGRGNDPGNPEEKRTRLEQDLENEDNHGMRRPNAQATNAKGAGPSQSNQTLSENPQVNRNK
ncbi:hypothetical protein [Chitinimonas lacunae]|uniref:Uncharacterized protein n=1 Tax=Chitinimonas lacunae TaxID=1963018 RepID=A0ABV8MJV8_9NEIS